MCEREFFLPRVLENSEESHLCFQLHLTHLISPFFHQSPSSSLCTVFYALSSAIDEVQLINPSASVFVLDFDIHQKYWLVYSGGTDRPGKLCYNFKLPFWSCHVVSVFIDFPANPKQDTHFTGRAFTLLFLVDWNGFCDHIRNTSWEYIFYLGASTAVFSFWCKQLHIHTSTHVPPMSWKISICHLCLEHFL